MKHKIEICEKCKKEKEQLLANPKGGCRTCDFSSLSDSSGVCKECFELYTPFDHYPKWKAKEEK